MLYLYITFCFAISLPRFPLPSHFVLSLPPHSSTHSLSLSPSLLRSHFLSHFPVLLIRCKLFKYYHFPVLPHFFLLLCHPLPLNLTSSFSCALCPQPPSSPRPISIILPLTIIGLQCGQCQYQLEPCHNVTNQATGQVG